MPRRNYQVGTSHTASQTMKDIQHVVEMWRRDSGNPKEVGAWDAPPAASIGGLAATVRLELRGQSISINCVSQDSYARNLRCCYLTIDGMRLNALRGIEDTMREAYKMLGAGPGERPRRDPYVVLGAHPTADLEDIQSIYRMKARKLHPDTGGDTADPTALAELNEAWEVIQRDRGARPATPAAR